MEAITNPKEFIEKVEIAILEGKVTGEAVLKKIENIVNGDDNSDISKPERRKFEEIKEYILGVKTAPEMDFIATGDITSAEAVKENLEIIKGVEKFDPNDPNLPLKVRERLDEVSENGEVIAAFYDKETGKIFVNTEEVENDSELRALVAREWQIAKNLKDENGKANEDGKMKSTVAGELAYDDMMKRAGENKTSDVDEDKLDYAVMSEDSEVTSDDLKTRKDLKILPNQRAIDKKRKSEQSVFEF